MATFVTDEEFLGLWRKYGSVNEVSKACGLSVRAVNARRRKLEEKYGEKLLGVSSKSPDFQVTIPNNGVRAKVVLKDGVIIVASDCHYWPGVISSAHRAFVKLIKELSPKIVCLNGDVFDGASISRFPAGDWQTLPTVRQELEACQERVNEIEAVAGNAKLMWTWGNHDLRFNSKLAQQVGDGFKGLQGFNLKDYFPRWKFQTSIMVNENTMIKHRWHNGIHAVYNNALKSGVSFCTGHLHSLKVTPFSDYSGARYGIDCGTLAPIYDDGFQYMEDSPRNWRAGGAVLTFYKGKLMPPELFEVIDEDAGLVYFRGEVFKI
jgi:Calcineurin-like phosphoesterase